LAEARPSRLSVVHVKGGVNDSGKLLKTHLKAVLDLFERLSVLICAYKGDSETLGAEATGAAHSVQVRVGVERHVEVEHNVDLLNIDATPEKLRGHKNTGLKLLEAFVDLQSVF